jgi:hypothetical protein
MIILRMRGGLGNQLFQYAAGLALAQHHNVPLKVDDYTYRINSYRKIELGNFFSDINLATRKEVAGFTGATRAIRLFHKLTNYRYNRRVFAQPYFHYYPDFFRLPNDIYLSGYWQSDRYFQPIEQRLKNAFKLKHQLDDENREISDSMNVENSISIHVRRGDYILNSKYSKMFGVIDQKYYEDSIAFMQERIQKPRFYLFSDSPKWCLEKFNFVKDIKIIQNNQGENSHIDLWLMSRCQHHIIANSTFSWWGAWLGINQNKTVVAPQKWFKDPLFRGNNPVYYSRFYNIKDLIPQSWKTM